MFVCAHRHFEPSPFSQGYFMSQQRLNFLVGQLVEPGQNSSGLLRADSLQKFVSAGLNRQTRTNGMLPAAGSFRRPDC